MRLLTVINQIIGMNNVFYQKPVALYAEAGLRGLRGALN